MSEVAENNYNNAGKIAKAAMNVLADLVLAWVEKKEFDAKYAHVREFAKWIKNGGECCFYRCAGDCKNELKAELIKRNIAFIELTNNNNEIIIKAPDLETVQEINRSILIGKQNYYQEVDSVELEDAFARIDKIENKEIISLHSLTDYAVEEIKNKCNDISKGFMVGISKEENDLYGISVSATKVLAEKDKNDFCKAYLSAMQSLYGKNAYVKAEQLEFDIKTAKKIAELKNTGEVKFVVGANDFNPKKYIEINSEGFIAYSAAKAPNGDITERVIGSCNVNDINYESELQRHIDSIMDITILDNSVELNKFLTSNNDFNSERPVKTEMEEKTSAADKDIVGCIDNMIKDKIETEGLKFTTSQDAFTFYTQESIKIMNAIAEDKPLFSYKPEDLKNLSQIYDSVRYTKDDICSVIRKISIEGQNIECHKARKKTEREKEQKREEHGLTNR